MFHRSLNSKQIFDQSAVDGKDLLAYASDCDEGITNVAFTSETLNAPCQYGYASIYKSGADFRITAYDKLHNSIFSNIKPAGNDNWRGWKEIGNEFPPKSELKVTADNATPGIYRVDSTIPVDGEENAVLICFKAFESINLVVQFLIPDESLYLKVRTNWYGTWRSWKKYCADS